MKLKTLKKKIRRLETRLLEGPKKLAKLKAKLETLVKSNAAKAKKKSRARDEKKAAAPKKVKRKLNLSPERREELAAAMRARWAARRAAEATPPEPSETSHFTLGQTPRSQ